MYKNCLRAMLGDSLGERSRTGSTDELEVMKCPKCEFEQIEESPDECARCGILFEKWLDRQEQLEQTEQQEEYMAPFEAPVAPTAPVAPVERWHSPAPVHVESGFGGILGSGLCQIGVLMIILPLISFLINLVGFEFILLMPLEAFDNPTHAKFWMMGIGLAGIVIGTMMGGEMPDED